MKSGLYLKFLSLVLAAMVLTGASGITLNAHYCSTSQTLEKSILPFPIECDHAHGSIAAAHCSTDSTDCCHTVNAGAKVEDKACCEDFLQYLKGLTDFELPTFKIKSFFNRFLVIVVNIIDFFSPDKGTESAPSAFLSEDPPPVSGKTLTIIHHQLKLDSPLS